LFWKLQRPDCIRFSHTDRSQMLRWRCPCKHVSTAQTLCRVHRTWSSLDI
jgi:hypothetical protein